jgi:hypothetical protein
MYPDGTINDNTPNQFNDSRFVVTFIDGKPKLLGAWEATTEPSRYWTEHPMMPKGPARIAFGKYTAWQIGFHHDNKDHEAWLQTAGKVTVCRDKNKDYKRDGDLQETDFFGINQHHGYDLPRNDLGTSSAGCLVGRAIAGHREFMRITRSDPRFRADTRFAVSAIILDGRWVVTAKPTSKSTPEAPVIAPAPAPDPVPEPAPPASPPPSHGTGGVVGALAGVAAFFERYDVAIVLGVLAAIVIGYVIYKRSRPTLTITTVTTKERK